MNFRRISEVDGVDDSGESAGSATGSGDATSSQTLPQAVGPERPAESVKQNSFDDEMALIRRVRIPYQPDILFLRHKANTYPLRFPAFSVDEGLLTVGHLRRAAAKITGTSNARRIKLLYYGRLLKGDAVKAKEVGLKVLSRFTCVVWILGTVDDSDSE